MAGNKYINDQWTLLDDLGIGRVGDEVARLVLEAQAPFTVGVTGKWGAGKTSILRRAYATLGGLPMQQELAFAEPSKETLDNNHLRYDDQERKPQVNWDCKVTDVAKYTRCVWFSPWQHQNEDNPLIPLLLEIETQFNAWQLNTGFKSKSRQAALAAATLMERVIDGAASFVVQRNIKVATGITEAVTKAMQQGENKHTGISDGQRFHLLFEDAIKAILPTTHNDEKDRTHPRLIIFIDDLDRCEEGVIIQLLEAIKLYLHSKHCLFVLGLDETAVLDALSRHWLRGEDINREYLEKLFQARIPVPLPITKNVKSMVKLQLQNNGINHDLADVMAIDVEKLLEPNPRKVKNFVNGLVAQWQILDAKNWINDSDTLEARRFVMFFYIQQYHRAIWRLLERQPEVLIYLKFVLGGETTVDIEFNEDGLNDEQQRMLKEIFKRAFSHVLPHGKLENLNDKHGSQKIDDAVADFINRQDRKRSDEYLMKLFEILLTANTPLNLNYLMIDTLDDSQAAGNNNE